METKASEKSNFAREFVYLLEGIGLSMLPLLIYHVAATA